MPGALCAGCHGTHGNSAGPATPSIAGMSEKHFIDAMEAFRLGRRHSTVMERIAKGFSQEEVRQLAAWFSAQKYHPLEQSYSNALAKEGAELHGRFCNTCHRDGGRAVADAPVLAGQPKAYLTWSLEDFAAGRRPMPRKMQSALEKIYIRQGEEGIVALVEYYASAGGK